MKITLLPYDKNWEKKQRQKFWDSCHKYHSSKRGVISWEKLSEPQKDKATSDQSKWTETLFSSLEVEILTQDLNPKEKEAVKLRAEGFSRREISNFLHIKANTTKQLIYRGYKKIKKKYANRNNFRICG